MLLGQRPRSCQVMFNRRRTIACGNQMQAEGIGRNDPASGPGHAEQGPALAGNARGAFQHLPQRPQRASHAAGALDIRRHRTGIQHIGFLGQARAGNG
ncbi:hypothetical protein D3C71_1907200 [compost metagenome]